MLDLNLTFVLVFMNIKPFLLMRYLFLLLSLLFVLACAAEKEYNQPREVARFWLENYYKNNFEAAKSYSTTPTQEMIDTIKASIFTDLDDVLDFKIKSIRCKQVGDEATCDYIYQEGGDKIPENITLLKVGGQWLVDVKLLDEDELLIDEDVEDIFNEFEQSLDKQLDKK